MKFSKKFNYILVPFLSIIFSLFHSRAIAVTNTFSVTGSYTVTASWSQGHTPQAGEDIVINANCNITTGVTTPLLNSITVNAGKILELSASTITINVTTLNVSGSMINTGFTAIVNAVDVNVYSGSDFDLGNASASSTNLNISGNLTCTGAYIEHSTGGSTAGNINFNGNDVVQQWNCNTTFADKILFTINGTHNSLQLLTIMTLSPKATVTVNSGDTLDCETFQASGMTNGAGGVIISSGAFIKIGSTTGLNGNIAAGNGANSFSAGATYIYSGTANQVTGTELPATVEGLTIRNPGYVVTLSQATSVTGTFTLGGGLLTSATSELLTLAAGASSSSGTTASYVQGPMAKAGNTAFSFPIGASSRFMPLGISAPSASTTVTAQYTFTPPINPYTVNSPLVNVSLLEYWTMTESSAATMDISLNWQYGPRSGIYTYTTPDLRVADYTAGSWHDLGSGSITGTYPNAGSVTSTTTIGSSAFTNLLVTFGTTTYSNDPLPITLASFNADYVPENNSVVISWTVASQLNNKELVIEKTIDGINYTEVASLQGAGTTPFSVSYSATDFNPAQGISYYRLKQIDVDGNPTLFAAVPVSIDAKLSTSSKIYPNPATSSANLNYVSENNQPITVNIIDLSGRIISSTVYSQVQPGENNFSLNTSGLSNGIYFLQIFGPTKTICLKFVKE